MDALNLASLLPSTFAVASGYNAVAYKVGNVVSLTMVVHPTSSLPADNTKYKLMTLPDGWKPLVNYFDVVGGNGTDTVGFEIMSNGVLSVLKYNNGGQYIQWTTNKNGYFSATYLVGGNE